MESKIGFNIYHDLTIDASLRSVFQAISQPEHLVNWWPLKCTGKPSDGEIYNFFFTEEYDWFGEVFNYVAEASFYIKMTKSDPDWDPTSFGFDLEEVDRKVLLKFSHVGWPECNHHFRRSSFCWAILLKGLKEYLEKGIILPFEKRS